MTRKGQGALEYLMTYGWALLVIVVVGAALYSLGILNPASYQQKSCTGFPAELSYVSHDLGSDFQMSLRAGVDVDAVDAVFVGTSSDTTVTISGNSSGAVTSGDTFVITADGITASGLGKASGETYSYTVTIQYDQAGTSALSNVNVTGTCTGTIA